MQIFRSSLRGITTALSYSITSGITQSDRNCLASPRPPQHSDGYYYSQFIYKNSRYKTLSISEKEKESLNDFSRLNILLYINIMPSSL